MIMIMKRKFLINPILTVGLFLIIAVSCKKDSIEAPQMPIVKTVAVSEITPNTAKSGGVITSEGSSTVTASGVCWSSVKTPTISDSLTNDVAVADSFISVITELIDGKTYSIRAYATNSYGTSYGGVFTFTTLSVPQLETTSITSIGTTTATGTAKIISDGRDSIIVSGLCWSTHETPTITDNVTADTIDEGSFSNAMTNLKANTIYYARAYATNSIGTGYGNTIAFRTQESKLFISIVLVNMPEGTFTMGSPMGEADRDPDETQHQVTLSAFKISKYEITNGQYAEFLNEKGIGSDGLYAAGSYPDQPLLYQSASNYNWGLNYTDGQWVAQENFQNHPVILVTWYGATEFASYMGARLPTEAEWEYAARANTTTPFNTGDCISNLEANYNWFYAYSGCSNLNIAKPGSTQSVSTYTVSANGLFNMHGNVAEWCSDWYGEYQTTDQTNPTGASTGTTRVIRGGSWDGGARYIRSACRGFFSPEDFDYTVGFRIVMEP